MKKCQVALNLPKKVQNLPHFLTIPPKVTKDLLFFRQNKDFLPNLVTLSVTSINREDAMYLGNVNLHFRYKQDPVGSQRLQPAAVIFIHLTEWC